MCIAFVVCSPKRASDKRFSTMEHARSTPAHFVSLFVASDSKSLTPAGSHQTAPLASTRLRNHSGSLFGTAQPRKLRVQNVDGCGGGFPPYRRCRNGFGRYRYQGAASSLVAAVSPAAASTEAAQLLWRFVEQNVGELGHGVLPTPHSLALVGKQSKSRVVVHGAGSPPIHRPIGSFASGAD